MLSQMRQKFSGQDSIDYRLGEAGSLPIPDGTVDYAFANMYLHHVEAPAQAILEMARIIKPGGILVITDLDIRRRLHEASLRDISVGCAGENCCATSSCGSENE
jgi:ubiquinone/menaquinone biosynthesis C-methylase UbiE